MLGLALRWQAARPLAAAARQTLRQGQARRAWWWLPHGARRPAGVRWGCPLRWVPARTGPLGARYRGLWPRLRLHAPAVAWGVALGAAFALFARVSANAALVRHSSLASPRRRAPCRRGQESMRGSGPAAQHGSSNSVWTMSPCPIPSLAWFHTASATLGSTMRKPLSASGTQATS